MLKYMRLQLFLVSKKVSTYIVPVVFAIAFFLMVGVPIIIAKGEGATQSMLGSEALNPLMLMLPFIISAIFVAIKALNIFKESEENGTELLIVSKPITRFKLVLGKFFSLYSLIFFFSLFVLIVVSLISLIDSNATSLERIKFSFSIAFGTLIIQWLLSSIIVFLASVLGKIGTMTLSILIPLILSITSIVLIPISGSTLSSYGEGEFTHEYIAKDKSGNFEIKKFYGYESDHDYSEKRLKKHGNTWYKSAAYFDVWTQLSSFYSFFQSSDLVPTELSNWEASGEVKDLTSILDPKTIYKDGNRTYYIDITKRYSSQSPAKNLKYLNEAKEMYPLIADGVANELNNLHKPEYASLILEKITSIINDKYGQQLMLEEGQMISLYTLINILNDHKLTKKYDEIINGEFSQVNQEHLRSYMTHDPETYTMIKGKRYIPKALLYFMWIAITLGMGGLVMFRYMRRDFK